MGASAWATERFGAAADQLVEAVPRAIRRAHEYAAAAQAAGGTPHLDPYGHTLKNRQHECLVEEALAIGGFESFQPRGVPFQLVRLLGTRVALLPWRYATNQKTTRLTARMKPSAFRRDLLTGSGGPRDQMTIEQAELTEAEIEAQYAEEKAVWEQLRSLARVVTVGYASNPNGIIGLGWGDVELRGDDGTVDWRYWEPLAWTAATTAHRDGAGRGLQAVTTPAVDERPPRPRFDDVADTDDDLPLRPRTAPGEPQREVSPPAEGTGTDEEPGDGAH